MTKRVKRFLWLLGLAAALLVAGFLLFIPYYRQAGSGIDPFLDALYGAISMFIGSFEPAQRGTDDLQPGILLEIVRTAALVLSFVAVLVVATSAVRAWWHQKRFSRRSGHTVVIGSTVLAERLYRELRRGGWRERLAVARIRLVDVSDEASDDGLRQQFDLDEVNLVRLREDVRRVAGGAAQVFVAVGDDMLAHQILSMLSDALEPVSGDDPAPARVRVFFDEIDTAGAYPCGLHADRFLLDAFGRIDRVIAERVLGPVVPGRSSGPLAGSVRRVLVVGAGPIALATALRATDAFGVVDSAEVVCIGPSADETARQVAEQRSWTNLRVEASTSSPASIAAAVRRVLSDPISSANVRPNESMIVVCDEYDARAVAHAAAIMRAGVPLDGTLGGTSKVPVVLVVERSAEGASVPAMPVAASRHADIRVVSVEDSLCATGSDRLGDTAPEAWAAHPLVSAARWALGWQVCRSRLPGVSGAEAFDRLMGKVDLLIPELDQAMVSELGWGVLRLPEFRGRLGSDERLRQFTRLVGWTMREISQQCDIEFVAGAEPVVLLPEDLRRIGSRVVQRRGSSRPDLAADEFFELLRWVARLPTWLARAGLGSVRLGGPDAPLGAEDVDRIAQRAHEQWYSGQTSEERARKPSSAEWLILSESYKSSNRDQVWMYPVYIAWLECTLEFSRPSARPSHWRSDTSRLPEGSPVLEFLAEREHERWSEEKLASGWDHAVKRDDDERLHVDLIPWSKLCAKIRENDVKAIRGISKGLSGKFELHQRMAGSTDPSELGRLLTHPLAPRFTDGRHMCAAVRIGPHRNGEVETSRGRETIVTGDEPVVVLVLVNSSTAKVAVTTSDDGLAVVDNVVPLSDFEGGWRRVVG